VFFRHPITRRAAWNSFKAVAIAQGITQVLKHGLNRRRPGALQRPGHFDGPTLPSPETGLGFPSGHTTTAFALASAISATYRKPYVTIPAFTLAGTVALARLNDFVHYPADVFIAAAMATWVGQVVSREKGEGKVYVALLSGNRAGLVFEL
jgi:membrane-associated phospholipid phosphatase